MLCQSPDTGATVAWEQVTARDYRKHGRSPREEGKEVVGKFLPGSFLGMRFIHPRVESFSDELYEILSSLPESVVYSCRPCSVTQPSAWRELLYIELRAGVEKVLACLLSSTLTQHLVTCSQVGDAAQHHTKIRCSHDVFTLMCFSSNAVTGT